MLEDCFSFSNEPVIYSKDADQYFALAVTNNVVTITKIKGGAIAQGFYNIDFTVDVNMNKLQPGGVAQNRISDNSVVYVRRDAELTVKKTWDGDEAGKEATFQLIGPKGNIDIIDTATVTGNGSATLYIGADKLNEGNNICTLREIVAESSAYVAGPDKDVVITKENNTVTINSIDGKNYEAGEAQISITNTPDSGLGTVSFKKLGEGKEQIGGGTFQLWKENADSTATLIEVIFYRKRLCGVRNLPPTAYYVKEITAPAGCILANTGAERYHKRLMPTPPLR